MKRKPWMSKRLEQHQNELRKRALKEKIEEKRKDYWRLYFDAKDIEHELNEKMMVGDVRRLVDIMTDYGLTDIVLEDEEANPPPEDEPQESDSEPPDHEDDIPPRQKGFWDEAP